MSKSRNLATLLGSDGSVKTTKYTDEKGGVAEFVASGTLPNGVPVILKDDGTVAAITIAGTPQSIPLGSANNNSFVNLSATSFAYDPHTSGKIILAYLDGSFLRVVMGTISGTTVVFGTYVHVQYGTFNADPKLTIAFNPLVANSFILSYVPPTPYYGTLVAGTISGTTITLGTPTVYRSETTHQISFAFDPLTSGSFIVSTSRSDLRVYAGSVSGTTLTYGSPVVVQTGTDHRDHSIAFDGVTAGNYVFSYKDQVSYPIINFKILSGTVSGTTVTAGSTTTISSTSMTNNQVIPTSVAGKFILTYQMNTPLARICTVSGNTFTFGPEVSIHSGYTDTLNSFSSYNASLSKLITSTYVSPNFRVTVSTVSGTTITPATPIIVNSTNNIQKLYTAFDPHTDGKFMVFYRDQTYPTNSGSTVFGQLATVAEPNLTADNFIGISSATYADGETATVTLAGALSDNQSGLTTNSVYYVQTDGTLTTSAGTPIVEAGRAISSTSLLLTSEAGAAGADGSDGIQGVQGIQGAAGLGIQFLGQVATTGDLPTGSNTQGDAYIVQADDSLHVWDGTSTWVSGGSIQGPQGIQGSQGNVGAAGSDGVAGSAGTDGADGADAPGYTGVHMQESEPIPLTFDEVWLKPTTGEWSKSIPGTPSVSALSEANITILAGTLESAPALSAGQNNIFTDLGYGTAASYLFDNRHRFLSTLIVPSSVLSIRTTGNSKLYIYKVIYEDGSYGQSTVYNFDKYWKEYNTLGVEIASYSVSDTAKVLGGNDGGITGVIPSPHSKVVSINIQTSTGGYSSGPSGNHVQIITSGAPTWVAHNTNDTSTDSKIATAITALPAGADGATGATGPAGADSTVAGPAGADGAAGVVAPPTRVEFTATENQATKTGLTYTVGNIDCYINGVKMSGSSFTASDGVSVTFTPALSLGEEVQLIMGAAGASGGAAGVMTSGNSLPATIPEAGTFFYKTDDTDVYVSNGTDWERVASAVPNMTSATGGTITTTATHKIHTFTTSGTFEVTGAGDVEYLVIAGGGGGSAGGNRGGGAGAGGYRTNVDAQYSGGGSSAEAVLTLGVASYTITVGAGGAGAGTDNVDGIQGGDSSIATVNITSLGGGRAKLNAGASGGSGAGGSGAATYSLSGGSGTMGQGYSGGVGISGNNYAGGGGGGAGAVGEDGVTNGNSGVGGAGVSSSITGTSFLRAGGGGGAATVQGAAAGLGGSGGGGNGGALGHTATSGMIHTGSGGGSASNENPPPVPAGSGGSGIVIIRYAL